MYFLFKNRKSACQSEYIKFRKRIFPWFLASGLQTFPTFPFDSGAGAHTMKRGWQYHTNSYRILLRVGTFFYENAGAISIVD